MTALQQQPVEADFSPVIAKLTKDIKSASVKLSAVEARYMVDTYYQMQENRKRAANQVRAMSESGEPSEAIAWILEQSKALENRIKNLLDVYSYTKPIGEWSRSIIGIGPVLAAGLMANIDIEKAPTVGHIWRFAGLDPTMKWGKGEKRPWNANLKTLCWKIGESFVKVSGNPQSLYGRIYCERKEQEQRKNEAGDFAEQAADIVKRVPKHAQIKKYKENKLPDGHLHMRAKRYAVKLFLSHWHEVAYIDHYHEDPPNPYPIAMMGHAHKIDPPTIPCESTTAQE